MLNGYSDDPSDTPTAGLDPNVWNPSLDPNGAQAAPSGWKPQYGYAPQKGWTFTGTGWSANGAPPTMPPGTGGVGQNVYPQYPWLKIPSSPNGTSVGLPKLENWDPNQVGNGIFNALALGKSGEDAVNWANQNYGGGYAYRADSGTYSLPGGGYVGKNGDGAYFYGKGDANGGTGAPINIDPSYLTPFGDQGGLNRDFGLKPPTFQAPGAFKAPGADDILQDPSYQFRRDQAVQVLQNSKAAQGLYNSGGTPFDLANLASNFASQEYGNVWNRDFGLWNQDWQNALSANSAYLADYQNARDTYYANQNNPFSKLMSGANIGVNAAGNAG